MQPCKTGDQPYSDASPNGECSLPHSMFRAGEVVYFLLHYSRVCVMTSPF